MLLKSRKPGPRAKQIDLPTIPYASLKVGSFYGAVMSHQCLRKDVMVLAKLVHGDVVAHMTAKYERLADQRQKRAEKKYQQRMDARKAEQIAYLQKHLAAATTDEERSWVQERTYHRSILLMLVLILEKAFEMSKMRSRECCTGTSTIPAMAPTTPVTPVGPVGEFCCFSKRWFEFRTCNVAALL